MTKIKSMLGSLMGRDFALGFLSVIAIFSICVNALLITYIAKPRTVRGELLTRLHPPSVRQDDHVKGSTNSSVTIIEYSDFQCPFCKQMHSSLQSIVRQSNVRWVYRHYPLVALHPGALRESEAAECAGSQGKFWEYADSLFAAQSSISPSGENVDAELIALAANIDLDKQMFQRCLASGQFDGRLSADVKEAESLEITGTPTVFINGHREEGAMSPSALAKEIKIDSGDRN